MSEAFLHDALVLRNGAMAVSLVAETSAFTMESDLFSIFTSITFSPWRPARPVMLLMGHAIYARSVPIVTPWLIEMTHLSQFPKSRNLSRKRNGPSIYKAINEDSITGWAVLTTPLAASKSMWTLPFAPWVLKMSVHSGVELNLPNPWERRRSRRLHVDRSQWTFVQPPRSAALPEDGFHAKGSEGARLRHRALLSGHASAI